MKNCKLVGCLALCLLLTSAVQAQQGIQGGSGKPVSGIAFEQGSWKDVLEKAAATRKWVFVDAYASWCGPCKMLKAVTFRNRKAAAFFNTHFINLSLDMEKGEGVALAQQWQIEAYPTLIILDEKGKPVLATVGFMYAKDLIRFAEQALQKKPG